ncbi:MAG: hypothetical protein AVDCRST_MAG55-2658 [uncultured Rubrobacteraceae bacterium]|uniref:Uncharacterized protein n=1 Tax=uncultured Rubrobacteraceae bacterium TaxID=349277 RepID=A0A6J4Q8K8_9ACTN|nr:MAG: hypothetical protein AVDCRST_MAG55-2658 [uncultured Rubrobacteraceae bacterium]
MLTPHGEGMMERKLGRYFADLEALPGEFRGSSVLFAEPCASR